MKKTVFSLAALAALIIAGCSKDDNDNSPENQIRGKWNPASIKVIVYDKEQNTNDTTYSSVSHNDYWDFRSDGNVYRYSANPDHYDTLPYRWHNPNYIIGSDTLGVGALTNDSLALYLYKMGLTQNLHITYILKK